MTTYRRATVEATGDEGGGIQVAVLRFGDGSGGEGVVLEDLVGSVTEGDEVIANTTAVDLGLGSGGYHFILWNLSRSDLDTGSEGHVMKLRYTPLQMNVEAAEEAMGSPGQISEVALGGMPVIAGSLHSQLLAAATGYRARRPDGRLAYIMTDGGSLPMKFSNTVSFLDRAGYLDGTVSCGHAFGGDLESVNVFGALLAAREQLEADAVVVIMGPGIVGTGSGVGFTGMEQAVTINAAASLGGAPIAIPRITFNDRRPRHYGLSHHTIEVLKTAALARAVVPIPAMDGDKAEVVWGAIRREEIDLMHEILEVDSSEAVGIIENTGFNPTVMGRDIGSEPEFFMASWAAGFHAGETGGETGGVK